VAKRSGDTALIFAWPWLSCIEGVLMNARMTQGAQTLPPKAVSPLRFATALQNTTVEPSRLRLVSSLAVNRTTQKTFEWDETA
jgi:hypothetical protein